DESKAENVMPHPPQPPRVQLQPDEEQQQDNAEFGEMQLALRARDEVQHLWPGDRAGDQEAEGGAEAEPPEDQHEDQSEAEQDNGVVKQGRACLQRRLVHDRTAWRAASAAASATAWKGSRIAPCRALSRRAGASSSRPGQTPGVSLSPASQAASASRASASSRDERPKTCAPIKAADACPKAQAFTSCPSAASRPSPSNTTSTMIELPQTGARFATL